NDRARVGDDDVARVAVVGQRARDEAVIAGITHRSIEEAVDEQRAARLVHLVFDRFAADRHLDDDIDLVRRFVAIADRVQIHLALPRFAARYSKPKATRSRVSLPNLSRARRTIAPPLR